MADVFLSYASVDRTQAQRIAAALESHGRTVWWDRKIIVGDEFDRTIERELDAARCVVVLWSQASVNSEWVKNEAAAAAEQGTLVPCAIESVKLPLEFRRKQTADLTGWDGNDEHPAWQMLMDGISSKLKDQRVIPSRPVQPPTTQRGKPARLWMGVVGLLVLAGAGFVLVGDFNQGSDADNTVGTPDAAASPGAEVANATQQDEMNLEESTSNTATPVASTNYALTCHGGGAFEVTQDAEGHLRIGFAAAAGPVADGLNPGECTWSDRALSDEEPRILCDDTVGAGELAAMLARQDETVVSYVHYDPEGECLRVVRLGG